MSVSLRGNLKDFGIAEVFQLIGQQRKTGVLALSTSTEQVLLNFDRGSVVSAETVGSRPHEALGDMLVRCGILTRDRVEALHRECGPAALPLARLVASRCDVAPSEIEAIEDLLTRETIFEVLRWQSGSFDFRAQEIEHSRPFETLLGAEQILMDGLRMVDEWQSFAELVPSDELVFQKAGRFDDYRGSNPRALEDAERVYRLVDGRLAVRRVIDLSLLGTFDATRILAELRRARVIEPLSAEGTARLQRRQRKLPKVKPDAPTLKSGLLSLIPLSLLLAVTLAPQWLPAPGPVRGIEIDRGGLEAARHDYEARRLRHALDAFRLVDGRWPSALDEVAQAGWVEAGSLASSGARPYYSKDSAGRALLLAPER